MAKARKQVLGGREVVKVAVAQMAPVFMDREASIEKAVAEDRAMVSVMVTLRCESFWEKLLVPPFIFFFKLLYPFAKVNNPHRRTAAERPPPRGTLGDDGAARPRRARIPGATSLRRRRPRRARSIHPPRPDG